MNTPASHKQFISPLRCDDNRMGLKMLLENMLAMLGVLVLANLAYLLRDEGGTSIVQFWPVSGLAVGLVLKRGICIVPGLAIGSFMATLLQGQDPAICLGFTVAGMTEWVIYSFLFWKFLARSTLIANL